MSTITMRPALPLLLSLLLLSGCNLLLSGPDRSEPGLMVDTLPGRWQAQPPDDPGDYLLVVETAQPGRYRADIYENGELDSSPLFSLFPDRTTGAYWGLARAAEEERGDLLFHLVIDGDRVEFRWLDTDRTLARLQKAGIPYDKEASEGFASWTRVIIRTPRERLIQALNDRTVPLLLDDLTLFRRSPHAGEETAPDKREAPR